MPSFIHRPYQPHETIAAIATAPGEGGVAIIRLSGTDAIAIADKIFSGPVASYLTHTAHFGKIKNLQGDVIDETLLLVMRAPKSYTGEDTVEIHCHGGSFITRKVLETCFAAGARAANPGEFTFRAFMNGKIDLSQAEAVQQLIAARSDLSLEAAKQQLEGALSCKISQFQHELVDAAATLEAWVDFPEEGIEFMTLEEIASQIEKTQIKMADLQNTFEYGKMLHDGLSLCLNGPPNAGKSSLMNALLRKERAIVTPIPGTTRDLLEEDYRLGGFHFKLIDTAGIRQTEEIIEQEGIRRSLEAMEKADLVLLVLDQSRALTEEENSLLSSVPLHKTIVVWNKNDLPPFPHQTISHPYQVHVSAKLAEGLDNLYTMIEKMVSQKKPCKEEIVLTNLRHKLALNQAILACDRLIEGLKNNISPEFLAADMRLVLSELGTIIGTNVTEDILSAIFSKFCIGK